MPGLLIVLAPKGWGSVSKKICLPIQETKEIQERKRHSTTVVLPEKSNRQKSMVGYSLKGCRVKSFPQLRTSSKNRHTTLKSSTACHVA